MRTAIAAITVLMLASCSPVPNSSAAPAGTPAVETSSFETTVTVGDLTPVLSLQGSVSNQTVYQITAPVAGVFKIVGDSAAEVAGDDGNTYPIVFRPLDTGGEFLIPDKARVAAGLPVAQATYGGFALTAPVAGVNLLKLRATPESAKAQVTGAGSPFNCELLDRRPSQAQEADPTSFVACIVPDDQSVVPGLAGLVALRFPVTKGALLLPVEAVAGSKDTASVFVLSNGEVAEKSITVGDSDGVSIVVTSGLVDGDVVQIPSPSLLSGQ